MARANDKNRSVVFVHSIWVWRKTQESFPEYTHIKISISRSIHPDAILKFGDKVLVKFHASVRDLSQAKNLPEDDSKGPDVTLCGEHAIS